MQKDVNGNLVMTKGMKIFHIITAIVMLGIIVTLAVFVGLLANQNNKWQMSAESKYQSSYYSLLDCVTNLNDNLKKMNVAKSVSLQQRFLLDIALESQSALENITCFCYGSYSLSGLMKYANQTCDFSKYCITKLESGQKLSVDDQKSMSQLQEITQKLLTSLLEFGNQINEGAHFMNGLNTLSNNFLETINNFNGSIKYPSLIYDGPFSESLEKREAKALVGKELTQEEVALTIKNYVHGGEIEKIDFIAENSLGFTTYLYEIKMTDGQYGSIQLSKQGGFPVDMTLQPKDGEDYLDMKQCIEKAKEYLAVIGLPNMKEVWATTSGGVAYINFCYCENDTIFYPDMIKIKVAPANGQIVGMEALNYIYNHTKRTLETPLFQTEQVEQMDFGGMEIGQIRICVIPTDDGKEKLAYEVSGTFGEEQYFVYVDALSGQQCKILRVIETDDGSLLL